MKLINHQEKKTPLLMIIPMIDIIFFLLVFFMMSMLNMVVQKTMPLNLPRAAVATIDTTRTLPVSIDPAGQVYVEDTPVSMEALAARLSEEQRSHDKLTVVLRGDRTSEYGRIVEVMDIIKRAGIERLSIATVGPSAREESTRPDGAQP